MKPRSVSPKRSLKVLAETQSTDPRIQAQKDIKALIRDLDIDSLSFLRQQAATLKKNQAIRMAAARQAEVQATPIPSTPTFKAPTVIDLEGDVSAASFFLVTAKSRSILSRAEVSALVKAAYISSEAPECLNALYSYLSRERKDILTNAGVTASAHQFFDTLYKVIRGKFKPKT